MPSARSVTLELDKTLIVLALAALVGLGWLTGAPIFERFGSGRLTYLTVLAFPLLLVALLLVRGRGSLSRAVLGAWWPVFGILSVYESLKHMHANRITEWLGIEPQDRLMLALDEALFGKALPLWMDGWTAPWFQKSMSFFYIWVYYLGPFSLLAYAYLARRDELFRRLRLGLVAGLLGGYVLYLLVPVAGPKFLIGDQFRHAIPTHSRLETLVFDTLRFNWDCFPSLHTAIPWLLTLLVVGRTPRWVVAAGAVLSSGVTLSTVALRFHYGVDLLAAFVWVGVVWWLVARLERRDYGRVRISLGARWRRRAARASPARAALARRDEVLALLGAGNGVALVALARWADPWAADAVTATGWTLAGWLAGLGGGAALARVAARRLASAHLTFVVAALAAVGWMLLVALSSRPAGASSFLGALLAALGGGATPAGGWPILLAALPAGALLGAALAAAGEARQSLGLVPSPWSTTGRAALGGAAGLAAAALVFLPVVGYAVTLLVAALVGGVVVWRCHGAGSDGVPPPRRRGGLQPPVSPLPPAGALVASGALGAALPAWSWAYASGLGEAALALPQVLATAAAGAALALAVRGRARAGSAAGPGWALVASALALAWSSFLLGGFPEAAGELWARLSPRSLERLRALAVAAAVVPGAAALAGTMAPARRTQRGGGAAALAGTAAAGCALAAFALLPRFGDRVALAALCGLLAIAAAPTLFGRSRRWGAAVAALVPLAAGGGLLSRDGSREARLAGRHLDPGSFAARAAGLHPLGRDVVAGEVGLVTLAAGPTGELAAVLGGGLVYALPPEAGQEAAADLAVALAPGRGSALVLGPALELAARLGRSGFARVTLVEPSALVLEAAGAARARAGGERPAFPGVERALTSARGHLATHRGHDLVVSHLEDYRLGLRRRELSREQYRLTRRALAADGLFVQAIRLGHLSFDNLESIVATLRSEFPVVSLRLAGGYVVLAASAVPQRAASSAAPPLLSPEQVGYWALERDPALESDRSGFLEWNRRPRPGDGDATKRTADGLLRLAGRRPPPRAEGGATEP